MDHIVQHHSVKTIVIFVKILWIVRDVMMGIISTLQTKFVATNSVRIIVWPVQVKLSAKLAGLDFIIKVEFVSVVALIAIHAMPLIAPHVLQGTIVLMEFHARPLLIAIVLYIVEEQLRQVHVRFVNLDILPCGVVAINVWVVITVLCSICAKVDAWRVQHRLITHVWCLFRSENIG